VPIEGRLLWKRCEEYQESRIRRCTHTDGEGAYDSSSKAKGGQQEAEGGEGQASRMRHVLSDEGIHLHTDYAILSRRRLFVISADNLIMQGH